MAKWKKPAGLLFLAASSVYTLQASVGGQEAQLKSISSTGSTVRVLADASSDGGATTQVAAATQPAGPLHVTMNESGTFSIQISPDTNIADLLRQLGNQAQINIVPSKDVRGTVPAMDLYNVTVHEALDAILESNGMHWQEHGKFIFVYTKSEWAELQKASRVVRTEAFHMHYISSNEAANLIKPAVSPDGSVTYSTAAGAGIDSSSSQAGGNTFASDDVIVVTDYPDNLEKIRALLKEVDKRPQQILIEATILQATLTDNNALGIDFSFLGGINFDTLLSNNTTVPGALSGAILSAVNSAGSSGGTSSGGASNVVAQNYQGVTTGAFDQQVPPGGLQVGVVHHNLGAFLQALESVTDTVVLANPKVLALDKQRGEVIVGRQDGYLTTTTTATTSTQTVEFLETGTRLLFRPYVGDDGYIRMEIHPEDSSGGLTSANLPFKVTTEVTSNVMVKDGNTIVIGGLFRENSQSSRSQVPFFGNLPIAGALFRAKADTNQRQEIIILLTPHIIKDDAAYARASEEEMKEIERLRVGVRQGMMWFGRGRLAELHYENAVKEWSKPHPDVFWTLWHLDCAINLNPQFLEAIDMKERITGQVLTDQDNSTIRGFVKRQIMAEQLPQSARIPALPSQVPSMPAQVPPIPGSPATRPMANALPATRPEQNQAGMKAITSVR